MNHWIIAPVVLPALLAPVIAFVMRHDISLARIASVAGTLVLTALALMLLGMAASGETQVYFLGNWPAPFGIVLVLDRLSALMLVLTSVLALAVLAHAIATGWDARGRHFHALFQFQLMGICGAFLTGDAFNLFVFFEVLLIASYGLMVHGGGKMRVKAGLQYVVINLGGSTLFLFALGTMYAATGTLNIADLALRVREIPVEDAAMVRVAAILLLLVFAVKAALVPLQFWLPATYANAAPPVAALFAIMTKVGAYAILRVHGTAFGPEASAMGTLVADWLVPMAIVTIVLGAVGVLGATRLLTLMGFAVISSMGTLMLAIAAGTPQAVTAALYYMVHSTLAGAIIFLLADLVVSRRAGTDLLRPELPVAGNGLLAALFFGGAIAMAGMPPLSGFLGKMLVLDALRDSATMVWAWSAILGGSLVIVVGFARAGATLFWKSTELGAPSDSIAPPRAAEVAPVLALLALLAAMTVFAGPAARYMEVTALQLADTAAYIGAVLPETLPAIEDAAAAGAAPDAAQQPVPDEAAPAPASDQEG